MGIEKKIKTVEVLSDLVFENLAEYKNYLEIYEEWSKTHRQIFTHPVGKISRNKLPISVPRFCFSCFPSRETKETKGTKKVEFCCHVKALVLKALNAMRNKRNKIIIKY